MLIIARPLCLKVHTNVVKDILGPEIRCSLGENAPELVPLLVKAELLSTPVLEPTVKDVASEDDQCVLMSEESIPWPSE